MVEQAIIDVAFFKKRYAKAASSLRTDIFKICCQPMVFSHLVFYTMEKQTTLWSCQAENAVDKSVELRAQYHGIGCWQA